MPFGVLHRASRGDWRVERPETSRFAVGGARHDDAEVGTPADSCRFFRNNGVYLHKPVEVFITALARPAE